MRKFTFYYVNRQYVQYIESIFFIIKNKIKHNTFSNTVTDTFKNHVQDTVET